MYIGKSKYKYVTCHKSNRELYWRGVFFKNGYGNGKSFKKEREAALYVDKKMIEQGKEPVNILVRIRK